MMLRLVSTVRIFGPKNPVITLSYELPAGPRLYPFFKLKRLINY